MEWQKLWWFLRNYENQNDLITGSVFKHLHTLEKGEKLYKIINYLNSIQFEINTNLLNYLNSEGNYLIEELITAAGQSPPRHPL